MTGDAFGTAALRAAVLEAWRALPARLREDANTEEDHARGYYRDRLLVELAQNASDAAIRAGVPGHLLLRLARTDGRAVLVAANTGEALTAAGVASLASMRASAKRDGRTVGRFGVGFAAVRAVSDEVGVLSTGGGVRFSLADTAAALGAASSDVPGLAEEVRRRDGSLPALRLPWPAEGRPPTGYDTAVVLELRDEVAADEVAGLLAGVDDALLLALPGLVEIVVEDDERVRRIADVERRWAVTTAEGELPLSLLADRPVEERDARAWRVTWALPREGQDWPRVVHAPTPTDDPLTLPALLVATLPLDPTRRHVAAGPLTDALLDRAADAYATLAARLADEDRAPGRYLDAASTGTGIDAAGDYRRRAVGDARAGDRSPAGAAALPGAVEPLALVPIGLASGRVDAALAERIVERLARTPLLAGAEGFVVPQAAVVTDPQLDDRAAAALAAHVSGLVRIPERYASQARVLGVETRPLAEVVDELPLALGPDVYAALDGAADDPLAREALAALPVPLAGGRVVRGARGTLLLDADDVSRLAPATLRALTTWGVRIVDPEAAHPVLERLGAEPATPAQVLAADAVRQAVLQQEEGDGAVTDAVLDVVGRVLDDGAVPELPWLGLVELTAADGEPAPAHGLVLPGSPAARLLDDRVLAPVSLAAVDRWGEDVLRAVGVRSSLVVMRLRDVVADPGADEPDEALDGWPEYLEHLADELAPGAFVGDVAAIADLDAVLEDAWPDVLRLVAGTPELRRALTTPVVDEHGRRAPSYTSWWLRTRGPVGGPFALGGASGWLPTAPGWLDGLDDEVLGALGGTRLDGLDLDGWVRLLDALPVGQAVAPADAVAAWRALARLSADAPGGPPEQVVAMVGPDRAAVVPAEDAAVAAAPMWRQRTDVAAIVPVLAGGDPAALADVLDLPLASELAAGEVSGDGVRQPVPDAARALLPDDAPRTWWEHDDLRVDGVDVEFWADEAGVHAVTTAGLAAGLAQVVGRWDRRWALEAVLADERRAAEAQLDD
ncbi:MAG: ATP-binding protein [Cellulomonas sp. 73-92]|uniref:ATP-binding protein n=1 Tax=Cellulomonas sp. 73-92 TaxID=1895740 RepID=UPI000929E63A|nr:ATP-binding protein [Cellulomonas sp. 73-92]OJV81459.1 MAG: ATP-binding protein [Cellulomonas sp. 73-92]